MTTWMVERKLDGTSHWQKAAACESNEDAERYIGYVVKHGPAAWTYRVTVEP